MPTFIFFSIALILIGIVLLNFKWFVRSEMVLSRVPLSEVELLGSCEFFAVARSDNFSAAAVQAFCHLPEGSRRKGTSRRLRFSNVLQLFSVGSEKNRPSGRTLLQCYGVTVPKIVARGGCKIPLYLYVYRYRIIFEVW